MDLKNYKPILHLVILAGVAFVLHKLIFHFLGINDLSFQYSIETLYLFFLGLSLIVFLVLLKVKQRSFDNVGMSFLVTTSIKMVFCYLMVKPILKNNVFDNNLEKINFFVIFILFLAIETVLTIRILNQKRGFN